MNASNAEDYARLCPSAYGPEAFEAVCAFIRRAAARFSPVMATVVGHTGVDVDAARILAETLGAEFRVR